MDTELEHKAQDHEFEEVDDSAEIGQKHLKLEDIKTVKLTITADLGKCSMLVRDILELKRGSIIQLDKLAGEMTDVYVNEKSLARGEVVVIADGLHVRIGELTGFEEQTEKDERK